MTTGHEILAIVRERPPGCLAPFRAHFISERDDPADVTFGVSCIYCGSSLFKLRLMTSLWKHGSEPVEIGVETICGQCGRVAVLFDQTQHGFDGEQGNNSLLAAGVINRTDLAYPDDVEGNTEVRVCFTFSIPMDELSEYAREKGRLPQEFFDWFNLLCAVAGSNNWDYVWECECA